MRFPRMLSALLLAAYLPACASYQETAQPLAEVMASPKPPEHVRVTTTDGATLLVDAPRVVHDSLWGTAVAVDSRGHPATSAVAIPLATVHSVEIRKADGKKTAVLFGVLGVAALAAGSAYYLSNFCPDFC
ncbi:MAG: hypothetical protein OEV95_10855 [Gemmatimonadota bacterium]|jgi:hypothetical protein|nr:hypothetical protein [Gemmatimonadota bacterium]MDH4351127.1 hypothetical protein [Gemmatimonadota bacterium]MDH5284225.1 hypothetical protein [Gemmatimonadota bacterium]